MKRVLDFCAAIFGLLSLAPVLIILALAVRSTSGRPILFRQRRVGIGGKEFTLYKFRTMSASRRAEEGAFDAGCTSRVTSVGRILRATKVDELPQLWNVVKGDMSLVGPRPEVRKWVDAYPTRWAYVLRVRPGITDPASIVWRNEEDVLRQSSSPEQTYRNEILPRKLDLYEEYIRSRSFWGDLRIIFRTLASVLKG